LCEEANRVACGTNLDPLDPHFPQVGVLNAPPNTFIANCNQTVSVSDMVTIDSL